MANREFIDALNLELDNFENAISNQERGYGLSKVLDIAI